MWDLPNAASIQVQLLQGGLEEVVFRFKFGFGLGLRVCGFKFGFGLGFRVEGLSLDLV